MMKPNNNLQIFETPEILSIAAADFILQLAMGSVNEEGRFVLSLSGGSTPEQLFSVLAVAPFKEKMPWSKTFIFWGDERCVPKDDIRNNANKAYTLLLDKVPIPIENIFPIHVEAEPAEAATQYESTIQDFFGSETPSFHLVLLGLGEDGHTASLFPETEVLHEKFTLVKEVFAEEQKMFRVTMTAPLINLAHHILFLVTGTAKAEILKTVLNGAYKPDKYPAQLIMPKTGEVHWFVDSKAATLLNNQEFYDLEENKKLP